MKTKIYCLASAKGGSGKTVICASFASFLAKLGKKVLLLDVDAATYGLTLLYLSEVNSHKEEMVSIHDGQCPHGLFDSSEFSLEKDVVHLPNNVEFVPATFSFGFKESPFKEELKSKLISLLNNAKEQFDYVFLDAQAGSDTYSQIAMNKDISHEVVIVSEYDPLSAAGVERLKAMLRDDLLYSRTWVLLNKMLPDFVNTFSDFLEVSKYLTPIPWDPDVVRAYARRRLPLDLDYGNQFTLAVMQCLKKLLGPETASEIEKWAEGRASNIREPIEEQYRDAEKELKGLLEQKVLLAKKVAFRRMMRIIPFAAVFMMLFLILSYQYVGVYRYEPMNIGKTQGLTARTTWIIALFGILLSVAGVLWSWTKLWERSAERDVEEARFTRQLNIVEDRLKNLEVLRKADLETLVKEGAQKK
jgi:MinD-like ATPase involved in chromosome partitioning or flagellar assembly